jgi:NADH-quinone oxidoreductase subunit C/D
MEEKEELAVNPQAPAPVIDHYGEEIEEAPVKKYRRTEDMLLNMGPQHPSTHGVLRIVLELEGETIVKATPHLGYLHRGVEKLCEDATYTQIIPLTDRLDYTAAMTNNYAFVRTVEKLLQVKIPTRAEYIRTIVSEVQRLIAHLFWLGTQALDIGAMTVFFYTFREREILLDLFEQLCGARLTVSYFRIGGVDREMTPDIIDRLYKFFETFPEKVDEYNTLLETNRIWLARTKGVALISAKDAINFGLTGPVLRGSGVNYDVRKAEPYGVYDKVEWEVPLGKNGDTYDRYWIRVEEMRQSAKIVKQCLDQMPQGAIAAELPMITYPPRDKVMENMEGLIHHFMIATRGFEVPEGEVYSSIEAPKGELGFYIVSQGGNKPHRCRIRPPSFIHLGAFDHMARGYMIADIVTIFGTYDIVMGECDR